MDLQSIIIKWYNDKWWCPLFWKNRYSDKWCLLFWTDMVSLNAMQLFILCNNSCCNDIDIQYSLCRCPACRTTLIATRFWVVMICPIIKCLTVLRVFFYFVWFVFIHHNFQFHFELCTYCNILDIYLSQKLNFVNYLLFYMKLLNYLFFNMFGSVLECCELTGVSLLWPWLIKWK